MDDIELFQELLAEALLLVRLSRSASAAALSSSGIGLGERAVLQTLEEEHDGITVPQIARAGFSTRQNVRVVVNRLVAKGLARLTVNPDHRKSPLVQITAEGRGRLAQSRRESESTLQTKLGALEESELKQTVECLRQARRLISGSADSALRTEGVKSEPIGSELSRSKPRLKTRPAEERSSDFSKEEDTELPVNLL